MLQKLSHISCSKASKAADWAQIINTVSLQQSSFRLESTDTTSAVKPTGAATIRDISKKSCLSSHPKTQHRLSLSNKLKSIFDLVRRILMSSLRIKLHLKASSLGHSLYLFLDNPMPLQAHQL